MNCEQIRRVLDAFIDHELDHRTAQHVQRHLEGCASCAMAYTAHHQLSERSRVWREIDAPPELKVRIARALAATVSPLAEAAADVPHSRSTRREMITMNAVRWAGVITVVALAVAFWPGSRSGSDAVAAAIRATEAASAIHVRGVGSLGSQYEGWIVPGKGSRARWTRPEDQEFLEVDDMERAYCYYVHERKVEISSSQMGDPARAAGLRALFTITGALRELQLRSPKEQVRVDTVRVQARQLKRLEAPGSTDVYYTDPETHRVVAFERTMPVGKGSTKMERIRISMDYPEPAEVDSSLFRFQMPPDVTVEDFTDGS
jgi:hypothetical protein